MQGFLHDWDALRRQKEPRRTSRTHRISVSSPENVISSTTIQETTSPSPGGTKKAINDDEIVGEVRLQVPPLIEAVQHNVRASDGGLFVMLSDELMLRIFALLTPKELCIVAQVRINM